MARKKTITYMDENLMRSAKILAAKRNGKIYEVFEDALRRYLEKADWPGTIARSRGTTARTSGNPGRESRSISVVRTQPLASGSRKSSTPPSARH